MDEITNILVDSPVCGSYSIDSYFFFHDVCKEDPDPLIAIINGRIYEKDGIKYCINANEFQLDPVADAWLNK